MNKERKVTQSNAVVVFNRDVEASVLNELLSGFHGDVVVEGDLYLDVHFFAECNLYVMGNITRENVDGDYTINIEGDLLCQGKIDCYDIYVQGLLYCAKKIDATDINVVENLWCDDEINAYSYEIIVAGDLSCKTISAATVRALGKIDINGAISIDNSIKSGY